MPESPTKKQKLAALTQEEADSAIAARAEAGRGFMADTFKLIDNHVFGDPENERKVVKLASPAEIRKAIDMTIGAEGRPHAELLDACTKTLEY